MKLLGMRVCEHDTNFCYYDNGDVKYHKTERTYGVKHHAFNNLWEWQYEVESIFGLNPSSLDAVAIVLDPAAHGIDDKLENNSKLIPHLNLNCPVWWINHHLAHSLSYNCVLEKPSDVSIIIDGFGDEDVAWSVFKDYDLIETGSVDLLGSVGIQYDIISVMLGIEGTMYDRAGKLMSLQSYGNVDSSFYEKMKDSPLLEMLSPEAWVEHNKSVQVADNRLLDWSRTCHELIEKYIIELFSRYAKETDQISYVGGVAQNVCWNTALKQKYKNLQIFPHCADDGLSIGALQFLVDKYNCPQFALNNYPYCQTDEEEDFLGEEAIEYVVQDLVEGKIVGIYQGAGEVGPRALGNRSILMNPSIPNGKERINQRVKGREAYRPFGATILEEYSKEYFINDFSNPYMLYLDTFNINNHPFDSIAHVDNTCRTQTIGGDSSYRKLLEKFYDRTGIPMLLNTSLNRGGKPICGTVKDAYGLLIETEIDSVVIGNDIYSKG